MEKNEKCGQIYLIISLCTEEAYLLATFTATADMATKF